MNAPSEIQDRLPKEVVVPCEYSNGRVTHILKPADRKAEFLYTIDQNGLLIITALSDGSIWKLERVI